MCVVVWVFGLPDHKYMTTAQQFHSLCLCPVVQDAALQSIASSTIAIQHIWFKSACWNLEPKCHLMFCYWSPCGHGCAWLLTKLNIYIYICVHVLYIYIYIYIYVHISILRTLTRHRRTSIFFEIWVLWGDARFFAIFASGCLSWLLLGWELVSCRECFCPPGVDFGVPGATF